jgi:hypothetical protein
MQGSLGLNYAGRPGSLVAAVASVDQTGTFVFDSRLEIQLAAGFQGDFWNIEGSNDTMISVKNVTVSPAKCWLTLQYNAGQGVYELSPLVIQPSETRMVDIKQLQSQHAPGANGEFLPDGGLYGGLRLVEEPGGRHFLMEASVFNPVTATCGVCGSGCLYPNDFFTIPGGLDVLVGLLSGQIGVSAHMCDGTTQTGWECSCSFASNDTSVATVNPDCAQQATGISPGETNLVGTGAGVPGPHCGEQTLFAFCDIKVHPKISGPTSLWFFQNQTPSGYATTITLTASPSAATSYMWTIPAGADKVNFVGGTTTETTTTNQIGVSSIFRSDTSNDITVQVQVNGVTSVPFNLTSLAPYRLEFIQNVDSADGTTGFSTLIHYRIRDQIGNVLPSTVPVNEHFTTASTYDYSGSNWVRGPEVPGSINPSDWADHMAGPAALSAIPLPQAPCLPVCGVKVLHFDGYWKVGSLTTDFGVKVQSSSWQHYQDHGRHFNVVSPPQ